MSLLRIVFFGSTTDSLLVLEKLHPLGVVAVVTQPPRPIGRKQIITPTPVETWAKTHNLPVLSFASDPASPSNYEHEQTVIDTLMPLKAGLLVSASYGQKIPSESIASAQCGGLNVHPSLLPHWRGADPVPWAILTGDHQTGVTVVTLSEKFDEGRIIAQKKLPIFETDYTDPLRARLFSLGAELLAEVLPDYINGKNKGTPQKKNETSLYARRLTRQDGFEPWETVLKAMSDEEEARRIDRKFRAFDPWPGVWTIAGKEQKRLKIIACHLEKNLFILDTVQVEGKNPIPWKQFSEAYLS